MGDRANVCVKDSYREDVPSVYFYTHWGGSELFHTVQNALSRKQRWDDGPYLARIIFCTMIKEANSWDDETGFGISTGLCDNSYPVIVVDPNKQIVGLAKEDKSGRHAEDKCFVEWSFKEFIGLSEAELKEHWN
jgi:hypothetical protein